MGCCEFCDLVLAGSVDLWGCGGNGGGFDREEEIITWMKLIWM